VLRGVPVLRAFRMLLQMEVVRLLRSPSVVRILVLPAAFLVPVTTLSMAMVMQSGDNEDTVIVPTDLPEALTAALDESFVLHVVDDPLLAWEAREGDAAILAWEEGDGLGHALAPLGPGSPALWNLTITAPSEDVEWYLRRRLKEGARAEVDGWIAASGQDPDAMPGVFQWRQDIAESEPILDPAATTRRVFGTERMRTLLLALVVLMATVPGAQLLPIIGAHERESGLAEQLAVAPPSAEMRLLARLLAFAALVMGLMGLVGVNMTLPLLGLGAGEALSLIAVVEFGCRCVMAGLTGGALAMVAGEAVSEPSRAMTMGGYVVYGSLAAVGLAASGVFAWTPVGSLAVVPGGLPLLATLALHLVLVGGLIHIAARLHRWRLGTRT
jgi:hypothetical protein